MDISIRQGETLQIPITADDTSAVSVRFQAAQDGVVYIDEEENFTIVDGKAVATISTQNTTLPVGEYEYMLTITYSDGVIDKLPDPQNCDGDCSLPALNICEGEFTGVS